MTFIERVAVAFLIALLLLLGALSVGARAQENPIFHEHGSNDVPDWYDEDCCNKKDCRPVPYEDVEEIGPGEWLHKPTGLVFKNVEDPFDEDNSSYRVRPSKDGRFHVCFIQPEGQPATGYCIYVITTGI